MEDSLKGIRGLGLDLLVLLDRPTAVTNVSRLYNGSSTFKFLFTHMNSPRHFQFVGNCYLHMHSGTQADRLFNKWLSSLPWKSTRSHWKGKEAHAGFYG